nr:hypothetical protein [Pyrinomonadaceae bacterium]
MLYCRSNSQRKYRTFVVVALTAMIALTLIGGRFIQTSRAQASLPGTVSGIVVSVGGVPLLGATVTLRDTLTGAT